jgi:hypothetical protein
VEALVAGRGGVGDGRFDEGPAEAGATSSVVDEEAFHFKAAFVEGAQGDAAVFAGKQNQLILAGERGEFLLEGLEAKIDVDVGLIVAKQALDEVEVRREAGRADVKLKVTWVQRPKIPFKS